MCVGYKPPRLLDLKKPPWLSRISEESPEWKDRAQIGVWLDAVVDEQGKPIEIKVASSPDKRLNATAIEALKESTIEPARRHGEPIKAKISVAVRLRNPE
jgi:TonB family protein